MADIIQLECSGPYQKMYTTLFNAITDALRLMEQQKYAAACVTLTEAQCEAEDTYITWGEHRK